MLKTIANIGAVLIVLFLLAWIVLDLFNIAPEVNLPLGILLGVVAIACALMPSVGK